ncbi:Exoglucanase B [Frankliniella fusca]|uniref:Exoglucanase B n=1 Tax=Frankliniella fusca TaxID=407009 RepID=A0AAE1GYM3_9NEOP|nr:Exoglucanase B [Frankliniella fusca]
MSKRSPSPSSLPRRDKKSYEEFLASSSTTRSSQAEEAQKLDVGKTEATQLKVRTEAELDVGNIQLPSTSASSKPSQTVQTGLSSLAAACVITHPDAVVISNVSEDSAVAPLSACPAELHRTPIRITTTSEPGLSKNLDKEYVVHLEEEEGNFDVFCCPDVGDIDFPDVGKSEAVPHAPDLLYPGSSITVTESITSILAFAQSEDIIGAGLGKLLNLINIHLPQPNNCMKTTHSFYKQLESADAKFTLDYYCSVCWKIRASPQDICDTCIDPNRKVDYFVSLPLGPQIAKLFSRPGFVDKLQYKHKRTKKNQSNFEDIYDGRLYKEAGTFLCDELSMSLMWYTDGIALYECSSYSLWPFFYVINELPPEERFKRENIIMGALWGCHEKPHPNIFLQRTCQEILALKEGVEVNVHGQEKTSLVKGYLICGAFQPILAGPEGDP